MIPDIENCIFADIETIETDNPDVIADIDCKIVPPGTMTKRETIAAWTEEKRPDVVREAVAKTALEGSFGRIASIAFALGNGTVVSATSARPASGDRPAAYDLGQEKKLLDRFWSAIDRYREERGRVPTIVGHNVSGFDIRWIWQRSVIVDVRPPLWWPVAAKPWEAERVFDTMIAWCGVGNRISQDRLCLALGLPRKNGFDGSKVGEAWRNGEFERVRAYNADDVTAVREIWKRIVGWKPAVAAGTAAEAPAETKAERDAAIASAVRTSQNGGQTALPAFETETVDVGTQSLDRPIRTGVGFRPGRAATTGAAA